MRGNRNKWLFCIFVIGLMCIGAGVFLLSRYSFHSVKTVPSVLEDSSQYRNKDLEGSSKNPGDSSEGLKDSSENEVSAKVTEKPDNPASTESSQSNESERSFIDANGKTVEKRILTPEGFERVKNPGGFGKFLRNYPVYKDGKKVKLYDGTDKWNQSDHIAVLKMKLVDGDLQQCADSIMRLYGEYFYQAGEYEKINFHLVNGFAVDFARWQQGWRVSVNGDNTSWTASASPSDSKQTFEKYLRFVFAYASTLSMEKESKRIKKSQIQAGDIFIYGGSPGHVVLVMDVCENEAGEKAFLLGQGYMPAQQFHVLRNPLHEDDPWYYVSELTYPLETPEYSFDKGSLRRPGYNN